MTVLAYVTAPVGTDTDQTLGRDIVAALESLGAVTVLAEVPVKSVNGLVARGG